MFGDRQADPLALAIETNNRPKWLGFLCDTKPASDGVGGSLV
jgi:hypothetical protein